MKKHYFLGNILGLIIMLQLGSVDGATISGTITSDEGKPVKGQVSVAVVEDLDNLLLSAVSDLLRNWKKTERTQDSDLNGIYKLTNVPENVNLLVMCTSDKLLNVYSAIKLLKLAPGQNVTDLNFILPSNLPQEIKLSGNILLGGPAAGDEKAGAISVIKKDQSVGAYKFFFNRDAGRYEFKDLPEGEYKVRVDYIDPDGKPRYITKKATIQAAGSLTLDFIVPKK